MRFKLFCVAVLSALIVAPALADEVKEKKKGKKAQERGMATQLIKRLAAVNLTEGQVAKIKEIGKAADEKSKEIRDSAGLTNELMKKFSDAQKSMKDSGLKRKELTAAVKEKAGLSDGQATAMNDVNAIRLKLQKDAVALLTDEQKEALPEQMKRLPKNAGEPKRKKKKDQ